tara:strand:+ start:54 stop:839 length:786 start_codon:yes stop_codon:yes gene_type:complete
MITTKKEEQDYYAISEKQSDESKEEKVTRELLSNVLACPDMEVVENDSYFLHELYKSTTDKFGKVSWDTVIGANFEYQRKNKALTVELEMAKSVMTSLILCSVGCKVTPLPPFTFRIYDDQKQFIGIEEDVPQDLRDCDGESNNGKFRLDVPKNFFNNLFPTQKNLGSNKEFNDKYFDGYDLGDKTFDEIKAMDEKNGTNFIKNLLNVEVQALCYHNITSDLASTIFRRYAVNRGITFWEELRSFRCDLNNYINKDFFQYE